MGKNNSKIMPNAFFYSPDDNTEYDNFFMAVK